MGLLCTLFLNSFLVKSPLPIKLIYYLLKFVLWLRNQKTVLLNFLPFGPKLLQFFGLATLMLKLIGCAGRKIFVELQNKSKLRLVRSALRGSMVQSTNSCYQKPLTELLSLSLGMLFVARTMILRPVRLQLSFSFLLLSQRLPKLEDVILQEWLRFVMQQFLIPAQLFE